MSKRNRRNASQELLPHSTHHQPASPTIKKFIIKYLNQKQKEYGCTIRESTIVFAIGSAGSGKTHLAALHAMEDYLAGHVDRIIVCRPVVNAGGEELGFLPGTLQEKMDPYIRPIFDAFQIQWHPKQIQTLIEYGKIEIAPLAYMRGRTFNNAFIICDEAQNATDDQLLMLLSRLGSNSKMVITGDPSQRDIRGWPFERARRRLGSVSGIAFVDFTDDDVVRHPLVQKILKLWQPSSDSSCEAPDEIGTLPNFISATPPVYVNGSGDD